MCFEKFFNKFRNVEHISTVVQHYKDTKQEIKKSINRVIYLDELAKFQRRDKGPTAADRLKADYMQSVDNMSNRFRSFNKQASEAAVATYSKPVTDSGSSRQKTNRIKAVDQTQQSINKGNSHILPRSTTSAALPVRVLRGNSSATLFRVGGRSVTSQALGEANKNNI